MSIVFPLLHYSITPRSLCSIKSFFVNICNEFHGQRLSILDKSVMRYGLDGGFRTLLEKVSELIQRADRSFGFTR